MSHLRTPAASYQAELISIRRDLHQHPELAFKEIRTAGVICNHLDAIGVEYRKGVAETGVVALIKGNRPGKIVMLRFDMDALPIEEETDAEYKSLNEGVMHACGHDGHVAIGITVAKMIASNRDFPGSVKLIFQPAEEGLGGAERMIREGALQDPKPDMCFALHLWNEMPLGWLGIHEGPLMAGSEIFTIRILGQGGHGGMPDQVIDPVVASAHVITAIQTIISRNLPPLESAVISICTIHGGSTHNVVPSYVDLSGTIRFYRPEIRDLINSQFESIVRHAANALGCSAEIVITPLTPPVMSEKFASDIVINAAQRLFPELEIDTRYQVMVSEDMAFMLEKIPGCYFLVGSANTSMGLCYSHHHPKFDFDERALGIAAELMTEAALLFLNEK